MSATDNVTCGKGCACLTDCGDYYEANGLPKPPASGAADTERHGKNKMNPAAPASLESGLVGVTMEPSANLPRELMESYLAVAQEETFKGFSESVIKDQITRLHETVYRMGFECGWRIREEIAARAVPGEPT